MAKDHYTLAEASKALRVSEDQVRTMVKDGQLREFRDAGKLIYRREDVDKLASKEGSSIVDLALDGGDSGEITLADSGDLGALARSGGSKAGIPSPSDSGAGVSLADSGSINLADEPPIKPGKGDTKISSVGISVFDDDELQIDADPMAETRITASPTEDVGIGGGVGSGSGLMDLTRESDDTSLGAELLDVISPTDSGSGGETETQPDETETEDVTSMSHEAPQGAEPVEDFAPAAMAAGPAMATTMVYPVDPSSPIFTGLLIAALVMLTLSGLVAASAMQGVWPGFLAFLAAGTNVYLYVVGGGALIAIIGAGVGFAMSSGGGPPKPKKAKPQKPAKAGKAAKAGA